MAKTVTPEAVNDDAPATDAVSGTVLTNADPDPAVLMRLAEQQSIIFADISSYVLRTAEVQQRVGRALNVIRANDLWRAARDGENNGFKSFSAYLTWLGEQTGYARTNYLRMQKDDVQAYLDSGEAPDNFKAPESRGGASGVKYSTLADAADVTLRQLDGFFDRWTDRALKVRTKNDEGEAVDDDTLTTLRNDAYNLMDGIRAALVTLSATE